MSKFVIMAHADVTGDALYTAVEMAIDDGWSRERVNQEAARAFDAVLREREDD